MSTSLLDLYYSGAISRQKISLKGAQQSEAVLALRASGRSLSTELWILLASWHVTLKTFAASTMRTCLLTTCALALVPVYSGVLLVCVWSTSISSIDFHHFCVSSTIAPNLSKTRDPFLNGRPWSPVSSSALLCVPSLTVCRTAAATSGFLSLPLCKAGLLGLVGEVRDCHA